MDVDDDKPKNTSTTSVRAETFSDHPATATTTATHHAIPITQPLTQTKSSNPFSTKDHSIDSYHHLTSNATNVIHDSDNSSKHQIPSSDKSSYIIAATKGPPTSTAKQSISMIQIMREQPDKMRNHNNMLHSAPRYIVKFNFLKIWILSEKHIYVNTWYIHIFFVC